MPLAYGEGDEKYTPDFKITSQMAELDRRGQTQGIYQ